MFFLVILVITFLVIVVLNAKLIKHRAWRWAHQNEGSIAPDSFCIVATGNVEIPKASRRLFFGETSSKLQNLHFYMANYPVLLWRMGRLFLFEIPKMVLGWGIHYVKYKRIDTPITDKMLCDLVFNSPLLIAGTLNDYVFHLKIPDDLTLETSAGIRPAGLALQINVNTHTIMSAQWQNQSLVNQPQLLWSLLIQLQIHWAHPQTHQLSELSARQIAHEKIVLLEPSQRYVNALHDGLLYASNSPIAEDQLFTSSVKRASLFSGLLTELPHNIDSQKQHFHYYNFLWHARGLLVNLVRKHNLEINSEYLFHNLIIHSVDHYFAYKSQQPLNSWSLDGSMSIRSHLQSVIFRSLWVRDNECRLIPQRIKYFQRNPFYGELYQALAKIDKPIADNILCSTSF
jgi:hypothetical protein